MPPRADPAAETGIRTGLRGGASQRQGLSVRVKGGKVNRQ